MKAKRQILSLLLALVMVWQGFSFANAAGSNQDGISIVNENVAEVSSTADEDGEVAAKAAEKGSNEEANKVTGEADSAEEEDGFDDLAMLEELSKNFSEEDLNALIAASAMEVSDTPKAIDGVLSNYKLTIDGVDVQDGTTIPSYKNLQFKADIHIDSSKNVKKDDYILIKLPDVLKSESSKFSIPGTDDTGKPINLANGIYDAKNKEIKIIFTEEVKKYTSTSGNVYFVASIDKSALKESTKNAPLQITVNNETAINYTVNYEVTNRDNPVSFWKASGSKMFLVTDKKGITHYLIQYKITIDERNVIRVAGSSNFKNVQLVDELRSPELSYFDPTKSDLTESDIKTYSPTMQKGNWYSVNWVNNQWKNATTDDENSPDRGSSWKLRKPDNPNEDAEPNPWNPTYAEDGKSFTYTIGDLNPRDGYTFVYYAEINDTPKTTAYKNLARLVGDPNIKHDLKVRDSFVNIEGGFLNGLNTYNIEVRKTDVSNAQPLKDAEFTLRKKGSSYSKTAKTDEHGIASFNGLLYADYELEETKAPEGYKKVDSTIPITTGDLTNPDNVNKTFVVEVTNKKKPTVPPTPTTPATPSEIPPVTPGGNTPRTPGGGGNTPNNPGGGGNTPNPPTPPSEHPGEVLAAVRTPEGNVLGAERPAVLGVGRGYTKTEDSRNIWMNLALFAMAGLGFCTSLFAGRKKRSSR